MITVYWFYVIVLLSLFYVINMPIKIFKLNISDEIKILVSSDNKDLNAFDERYLLALQKDMKFVRILFRLKPYTRKFEVFDLIKFSSNH